MSRKVFNAGEILTASDVNNFLMDQSVMSFANAAARTTAIPSPVEGMLTYREDADIYEYWTGTTWGNLVPQSGNAIINGAFDIWQRGTTFTDLAGGSFLGDRWAAAYYGTGAPTSRTYSRQSFTLGSAPVAGVEGEFFARCAITTAGANTLAGIRQPIEDVRTFAGQTVTLSFYAKADSNRSGKVLIEQVFDLLDPVTYPPVVAFDTTFALTSSWQRFTFTFVVPSIAGKTIGPSNLDQLSVSIGHSTANGSSLDIWGVQLEAGTVATPFRRNANSIQGELAACHRYYERIGRGSVGRINTTTTAEFFLRFNEKRAVPTISLSRTNPQFYDPAVGTKTGTASTVSLPASSGVNGAIIQISGYTGLVAGNTAVIVNDEFVELSSEL